MKEIKNIIWTLGKIPFEGYIIYKISEILEKIARKGSLPRFLESDIIYNLYDKVDDITRFVLFTLMFIYYVNKWIFYNKEEFNSIKGESKTYAFIGVPVLSLLAGIIDRIAIWIAPMYDFSGKIDPESNTIIRPIETFILAFLCLAFMELRYSIFRWVRKGDWIGHFSFALVYVLLNIVLHCISFGFFDLILTFIIDSFVKLIFISILCPGLLLCIVSFMPIDT